MTAFGRWRRDRRGSIAVEFAIILPMLLLLSAGVLEAGLMLMTDASLEIAIRSASRYGITNAGGKSRDDLIRGRIGAIMNRWVGADGTLTITLRAYNSFDDAGKPEPFTDKNGNNAYDQGEKWDDVNGNDQWDADQAAANGGASGAIVLYTVTLERPGFSGVFGLIGVNKLSFIRQVAVENE